MSSPVIDTDRLEMAAAAYKHCTLCERRCGVDRTRGERGFCGATVAPAIHRYRVECGEETDIIPSQLLYLSGCNLRCVFCVGEENAFDPNRGQLLTSTILAEAISSGLRQGARNIQWVGGEPTIHIPGVLVAMAACTFLPQIVWKSNFFGTIESFAFLNGVVDVYVADFKYGNNACASRIAAAEKYMEVISRNLLLVPERARLIVRHLLLPGHFDCCFRPILSWMKQNLPQTPFRIMTGYLPRWQASLQHELAAPLKSDVATNAVALARDYGLNVIA